MDSLGDKKASVATLARREEVLLPIEAREVVFAEDDALLLMAPSA
jgi:hypothetical protein